MDTSAPFQVILEHFQSIQNENERLSEDVAQVRAMFDHEDRGWKLIEGVVDGTRNTGLTLDDVKNISEKARAQVAGSALVKRAADLHAGYIFGNGVEIEGTTNEVQGSGKKPAVVRFYNDPVNQENLFSGAAKRELQYSRFTDGNVFAICDPKTKQVRRIPITEIVGVRTHPDHPDEIWMWLREWNTVDSKGERKSQKKFYYTNRVPSKNRDTKPVRLNNESIPVAEETIVDLRSNRQVGWPFGVPDATAGLHWSRAYGEVLRYGQIVNEQLAKIIYKVVNNSSAKGAQNAGVKMSGQGYGGTAAVGQGQDIQLVNTTQRSFDFAAARPLAAMAATAWNVSNIDLLSDSSAAGSSYGAAQSLTPGMQNAMNAMRDEWTQFYQDIFEVLGMGRPRVHWPAMEKPDPYRMAQELTLYSIALKDEEFRGRVLDILDIPGDPNDIPETLKLRGEPQKQAASPDQGKSKDSGNEDSTANNDTRTDNNPE